MAVNSSWRNAERTELRPVKRERPAPTAMAPRAPRTTVARTKPGPPPKNHGSRGRAAPTAKLGGEAARGLKILAVAEKDGGPYVPYSLETLHDRSYPLYSRIYAYADRAPDKPMDPRVAEFLRFVVSQEGQAEVQHDGKYLPLTADVAKAQLKAIDERARRQPGL